MTRIEISISRKALRLRETNFVKGMFGNLDWDRRLFFLMSSYFNELCVFLVTKWPRLTSKWPENLTYFTISHFDWAYQIWDTSQRMTSKWPKLTWKQISTMDSGSQKNLEKDILHALREILQTSYVSGQFRSFGDHLELRFQFTVGHLEVSLPKNL